MPLKLASAARPLSHIVVLAAEPLKLFIATKPIKIVLAAMPLKITLAAKPLKIVLAARPLKITLAAKPPETILYGAHCLSVIAMFGPRGVWGALHFAMAAATRSSIEASKLSWRQ